ncbi:hypothetical protein ACEPAF_7854 [Sanghuangporus sanghuang]
MVKHAESKSKQKKKAREKIENNIRRAMEAYRAELIKPKEQRLGLRKITAMYDGVTVGTLRNRVEGGRSITEFNATKQKLSREDEEQLTALIQLSSDRGLVFTHDDIRNAANAILRQRHGPQFEAVGIQWVHRYLERHYSEVKTYWSTHLDCQRADCLNPVAVKKWFDIIEKEIVAKKVLPELIFGMDESGFQLANDAKVRCVGRTNRKLQPRRGGANRENITALVTICADGTALKPLMIFKGQHVMTRWTENNMADVRQVYAYL